jgi:hypothetical protein
MDKLGEELDVFGEEFERQVQEAGRAAFQDSPARGLHVFYRDRETGLDLMGLPDGRRFEIEYIPDVPGCDCSQAES